MSTRTEVTCDRCRERIPEGVSYVKLWSLEHRLVFRDRKALQVELCQRCGSQLVEWLERTP